jgi:hypothetical protein
MGNPMDESNIVRIYSAANTVEAYAVANALQAEGIEARVEGEQLGGWTGGLSVGTPIEPIVWVSKEDELRALQLIEEYKRNRDNEQAATELEAAEIEQQASEESAATAKEPSPDSTTGPNRGFLSPLLVLIGIACLGAGVYYAMENYKTIARYSRFAKAELVNSAFSNDTQKWSFWYDYQVDNVWHTAVVQRTQNPEKTIVVRYDPKNPGENYAEPILHPIWCLAIGGLFGGLALFLAYQFRA